MNNLNIYQIGIEASKNFIEEAKIKGVTIIFEQYRCFFHNVELWYIWLNKLGISKINVVMSTSNVKEDDLCIIIAHLFPECPSKKYIAIQTEDLTQKKYIIEKICRNACAIWDYSKTNVDFLDKNYGIKTGVHVPITFSDNTKLFRLTSLNNNFQLRYIDVIIPMHNDRRSVIKKKLEKIGLSCISVWRDKLPKYVNKCKVFLNIHRDSPNASLEIHRIMDVRNAPIVVISESSLDVEFENKLSKIPFVKYEKICQLCFEVCKNKQLWEKYVGEQLEMWKYFSNDYLHSALDNVLYN